MTATQKAKQQIRELQETLEFIEELEAEEKRFEESIKDDDLTDTEYSKNLLRNLEETREALRANIAKWNELLKSSTL